MTASKGIRRSKGDGSLTERSPGVWRLRVYLGTDPATGRPRQLERTYKGGKTGALKTLRTLTKQVQDGQHRNTSVSMAHLFDQWATERRRTGIRPTTLYTSEGIVRTWLLPHFGHMPIDKITARDLDTYYGRLAQLGKSPGTIRLHHNLLSSAFSLAVRWEWIRANPAQRAKPPPPSGTSRHAPTFDDVRRLVAAAGDDIDLATLVVLGALTGARRGELLGLQWGDVDWVGGAVTFRRARVPAAGGDVTGPLKTAKRGAVERRVSLGGDGMGLLAGYRAAVVERAVGRGVVVASDGWVFSDDCGVSPLSSKVASAAVSALGRRAGVRLTLHELRHFAGTQLVAAGLDVRTTAGRLGHDPTVLLRVYSHTVPELDRQAAEALEAGLRGRTPGG